MHTTTLHHSRRLQRIVTVSLAVWQLCSCQSIMTTPTEDTLSWSVSCDATVFLPHCHCVSSWHCTHFKNTWGHRGDTGFNQTKSMLTLNDCITTRPQELKEGTSETWHIATWGYFKLGAISILKNPCYQIRSSHYKDNPIVDMTFLILMQCLG